MKKGIVGLIILLLGIGVFLLRGCSNNKNVKTGAIPVVDIHNQHAVYLMAGKIEANQQADITSKITAKVAKINVDVGSIVQKGDVIIQLDSNDLQAQVAQAQATLDNAGSNYQNAKSTYERNQRLFNAGLISKSQFDQYQTAFAVAEASTKSAEAAVELARTQFDKGTILSPISGVISAKNINNGELAVAGIPLSTVVNSNPIIIDAYAPAAFIAQIKTGQKVVVKISEISDRDFTGQISVIAPVIDSKSKNILVKVKLRDQDPLLKPGMFAEIGLIK
jgi:HlyD family secretion protein